MLQKKGLKEDGLNILKNFRLRFWRNFSGGFSQLLGGSIHVLAEMGKMGGI